MIMIMIVVMTRCLPYGGYVSEGGAYNSLQCSKLSRGRAAAGDLCHTMDTVQQHYLDSVDDDDRFTISPLINKN